ncbi:UDP-glycosyltransferase UGT4 [Halyomorpha halys]|uniref:UDP-glycosyltransferase UGT4 n=1 Tax=Halyomorpha halys TaxID=286706 RepID=UPI0006D4E66E|nr:UDP-glucuronosyltransferase-like [Halyomorpha halys]
MNYILAIILVATSIVALEGAKILIALPIPWYSHTMTFMPAFKELAKRGHQVTMVSPFPQKKPLANWTDLPVDPKPMLAVMDHHLADRVTSGHNVHTFYISAWDFFTNIMEAAFQDPTLQEVIKSENLDYDLVITEPFYGLEPLVALGHKLNVPVVAIHPLSLTPWGSYLTGNEMSFHLMPNIRTVYTNEMTFFQRLNNVLVNLIEFSVAYFHYLPTKVKQMEKYMVYPGSVNRPSMLDMLQNVSLTLIDYHPSILYAEPLQPNSIPVGGLSLSHVDELPKDLKDVLDNAKNGAVFLSFGSLFRGKALESRVLSVLFETFSQLDQVLLMRWHTEDVPNKPKNVIIKTWMPQPSILAHPNLKLFITHAGLHGITEGAYFGVPLVCMPLFSDQEYDSRFVEKAGFGTVLLLKDFNKETLLANINEVLKNPKYKEVAMERSKIIKDKPQTALELAVYWVEYVIRHKGASHLKPGRQQLSLYQTLGLDIITFVLFLIAILILVTCKTISFLKLQICKNSVKTKKE